LQIREDTFGRAAQHEIPNPRVAVRAHDEQVSADLDAMLLKSSANRARAYLDRDRLGQQAARSQTLCKSFADVLSRRPLFIGHRQNGDRRGMCEKRMCIANGPRRNAASIPGNDDMAKDTDSISSGSIMTGRPEPKSIASAAVRAV
jgi:hypothetical protein